MTKTDEIIAAVTHELRRWAADIDDRENVRAVTISVKLMPGGPRAVICQLESETKFSPPAGRP